MVVSTLTDDVLSDSLQSRGPSVDSLRILGSRVDIVDKNDALRRIHDFAETRFAHHVITANTLMCLEAQDDAELRQIIEQAALVVPESWGICWASRLGLRPLKHFLPGIDLMTALCDAAARAGQSIFLLGAKPGVAAEAARALAARFPGLTVAGAHHGYFAGEQEADAVRAIRNAHPAYLFVGLSVPHQEQWIAAHLDELGVPVVMGVGGSFDVLSGRLRRAPLWMRRLGLEWAYRTWQEPWRWRRILNLPVFMWKVWRQRGTLSAAGQ
ncbi:MAG TPA: WecB/TagA/CpsF family glycosyltransferase [Elusimicrobiota bacterium]|nr:WecB/TagA/CpsF family glycosyltransferase [Elusimicrobiota bacterium]